MRQIISPFQGEDYFVGKRKWASSPPGGDNDEAGSRFCIESPICFCPSVLAFWEQVFVVVVVVVVAVFCCRSVRGNTWIIVLDVLTVSRPAARVSADLANSALSAHAVIIMADCRVGRLRNAVLGFISCLPADNKTKPENK